MKTTTKLFLISLEFKMNLTLQQKIFNLLDNFETGKIFLKSLEEIDIDEGENKEFLVSAMVAEYFILNTVNEDLLRFFLNYYSDIENSHSAVSCILSLLMECPTMNLGLYKEIEKKVHLYEKSFLSQCENISLEIRKYIIEELKHNLADGIILQGMKMKLEQEFKK